MDGSIQFCLKMQFSNGCKVVSCRYCCILFIVLAGCFCGAKFQLLAQVQVVLEKKAWMIWMMDGAGRNRAFQPRPNRWKWPHAFFGCVAILFVGSFFHAMMDLGIFRRRPILERLLL